MTRELLLGIDDAGRGPVIGPMCLAGCILDRETEQELKKEGVMDSKMLTPKKREQLVKLIKEKAISFHTELVSPSEIDTGMGIGLNLNEVEALQASIIINQLVSKLKKDKTEGTNELKIIIDCPSINTESWKDCLIQFLIKENKDYKNLNISCKHKADVKFPVVSAASIIAKTTRDFEIEKLKHQLGVNFGSGYPADPVTIDFLKKNINDERIKKARIFRESWSTYQNAKLNKNIKQTRLPDY